MTFRSLKFGCALGLTVILLNSCSLHYYVLDRESGVQLVLRAPGARSVMLASSIDRFQHRETRKTNRGLWVISQPADREFIYFYIIDGKVFVPDCPNREQDDFGAVNCIYQPHISAGLK